MGYITEKDMTHIDNQILDHTRPSTGEPSPLPESSLKDAIRNADAAVEFVPIGAEIDFDELKHGFFADYSNLHSEGSDASELAERERDLGITDADWQAWKSRKRDTDF